MSEPYQLYRVLLTGKAFLSYVAPSLKHLSQPNVALLHLISWINNQLRFKFLSC